ncbi:MAG TPA: site-specific integrase [Sphingobacteriaceae bacterium]|nr:site-specific integrase [Sphingobacteriaceae bacterium]
MVYYKLILDTKRLKDSGIYTIVVRITYNKNNTTLSTGVRIKEEYWDATSQLVVKSHPQFQILNQAISENYLKIQKAIHQLQDSHEFSFEALKDKLQDKPKAKPVIIGFIEFTQSLIAEMMQLKQTGNAMIYQTAVNRLVRFCSRNINFLEIDYTLLNGFKHNLMLDGVSTNTISNYFRTIRAIYNKAIKAKIVDRNFYPFYDIKIKQVRTVKRSITEDDLKKICAMGLEQNSPSFHARNYFLLSFSLIGISFTDLAYLKTENIVKDRIVFFRRKTHKQYNIKLTT